MKIYTNSGPEVNKKIQEQMNLIIEEIKRETPDLLSIMLAGSFGQGEGAVKKVGEEIIPFNDYDVYIISHKKLENKKVDKIIKNISQKINVASFSSYKFTKEKRDLKNTFFLDLKSFSTDNLKKVLPRLRNYSMKNATTILWGKDCRNLIPDYKLKDIPLSDAAKILLDRMNQLVEYYSIKEKPNQDIISYKIQTAYSACATSLLMFSQKFDSSYVKSMEILEKTYKIDFPELYEKLPDLHLRLKKYIKWKLNPEKSLFKDIEKELLKTINDILEVAKYFFSRFLNKKISKIDELSSAILNMGKVFYKPYIKKKFNLNGEFLYDLFFRMGELYFLLNSSRASEN